MYGQVGPHYVEIGQMCAYIGLGTLLACGGFAVVLHTIFAHVQRCKGLWAQVDEISDGEQGRK